MTTMSKAAAHWLAVCRAFAPGGDKRLVKAAALGGDGQDGQFEQAFSNLAHAFLKDKAPSLLDYEVGFQLMERNDDNTKAVGVFGFKVGPQWLYAPMFFISGDLKGHELLYIKAQDQFVPLKENWLNYLLQRRPNVLGRDVPPNLQQLGVMGPDLQAFSRPPTKFGSHVKIAGRNVPTEMVPGMAAFAHFARTSPLGDAKYAGVTDLPTFLKKEGKAVIASLVRGIAAYPEMAEKVAKFYGGLDIVADAIKAAQADESARRNVLEKAGLRAYEFGEHPRDQRGTASSERNGGKASSGYDAFRSLDGHMRRPAWTPDRFFKAGNLGAPPAMPGGGLPAGATDMPPPAPIPNAPAPGPLNAPPPPTQPLPPAPTLPQNAQNSPGGGVLGPSPAAALPPAPVLPQNEYNSPSTATPLPPAPVLPQNEYNSPPVAPEVEEGVLGDPLEGEAYQPNRLERYLADANGWLGQHAGWLPESLPGGRATAAMLGVGGLGLGAGALLANRKKKTRDEMLMEALAKQGEASSFQRRGPKGPFERLMEDDAPAQKPKAKTKGGLPAPSGVLAKMAEDKPEGAKNLMVGDGGHALAIVTMKSVSQTGVFLEGGSDEEKEKVKNDGVAFRDSRPEASVAYEVQTALKLSTPHQTGIYEVLTQPTGFDKCLVVIGPTAADGKKNFATVVSLDGKKKWLNIHPANLWTRTDEVSVDAYRKWHDGLSTPDTLKPSYSAVYMLVGPGGEATCPFEVRSSNGSDDAVASYSVRFRDYASQGRPSGMPTLDESRYDSGSGRYPCSDGDEVINLTGKDGGKLRVFGGQVYVPNGFKLLTLKADVDKDGERPTAYHSDSSDPPPIMPGRLVDVERAIYEKTASLEMAHDGTRVVVNGHPMHPTYALVHLVRDWGLREKQARTCLAKARAEKRARYRVDLRRGLPRDPAASHVSDLRVLDYVVKRAAGEPMDPSMFGGATAPAIPAPPTGMEPTLQGGVSAQYPQQEQVPVYSNQSLSQNANLYDPRTTPDPMAMQAGAQAAQTGQKEVFDTAMVGGLLKAVRDDTMVDRYLGDMMKGLDRIGRVLFSFYWHGEEFQERYGKKDMPELEDSLRNAFEQVGDVVLFLKQKTVEPFQDDSSVDLGATAEV